MFPHGSFAPSDRFGGAEALQARDDPSARRLLDQLSKGVFAAVKAGYARTVTYSVVAPRRAATTNDDDDDIDEDDDARVLEEYAFAISYGEETGAATSVGGFDAVSVDTVSVRAGGRNGEAPKRGRTAWDVSRRPHRASSFLDDEERIKDAGDQMLRRLEALIEHLDPAPSGSEIEIRLTYVDATPPEYEPPFFESFEPSGSETGRRETMCERRDCGNVETRFHALSLRWTGLAGAETRNGARADGDRACRTRVVEEDAEKAEKAEKALFPFPFESQPEPEPEPVVECRDYHYLSQSEPQPDSESPGLDAAAPAGSLPRIGWTDGFADGRATDPASGSRPGPGPAFSLTGSIPISCPPSSPFKPVGGGSRGAGRRAGDSTASFSFGGRGSQASLGANASLGFGGFGRFGGGGFGSPIHRGSAGVAGGASGKRAGAFPTPLSTPWRKRLRSADAVAI